MWYKYNLRICALLGCHNPECTRKVRCSVTTILCAFIKPRCCTHEYTTILRHTRLQTLRSAPHIQFHLPSNSAPHSVATMLGIWIEPRCGRQNDLRILCPTGLPPPWVYYKVMMRCRYHGFIYKTKMRYTNVFKHVAPYSVTIILVLRVRPRCGTQKTL